MRDRLRRMKVGALPVERNLSRSLRTIVAEKITKCCVARQCAKSVTSESSRHAKEWELRRKLTELTYFHSSTRGMTACVLARAEFEGLPTGVTSVLHATGFFAWISSGT
jgi:hypothetical protein